MDVRVGLWRKLSTEKLILLNRGVGEDSWEFLGQQADQASQYYRKSSPEYTLEGLMLKLNSSTLATSCKELTRLKRPWCWEGFGTGGKGDDTGWDGWMASRTRWAWIWVNSSRRWWWTRRPGVLRFMGSQRVGHNWATELNWVWLHCPALRPPVWPAYYYRRERPTLVLLLLLCLLGHSRQ